MKKIFLIFLTLSFCTFLHGQIIYPVPTAEVLPHKTFGLFVTGKLPVDEEIAPRDIDVSVAVGLFNRLNIEFASYFGGAYGLNLSYRFIDEENNIPRVAFGIDNVSLSKYVSSFGKGEDTRWENNVYRPRNSEQFSAYAVVGKRVGISNFSLGIGRGKFVGYGSWTSTLNSDYYMDENHNDAIGLFFDWKLFNFKGLRPFFCVDGRNYNYGLRFDYTHFSLKLNVITPNGLTGDDLKNSLFDIGIGLYSKRIFGEETYTDIGTLKGRVYDEKTVKSLKAMITISGKNYYNTIETTTGSYSIRLKEGIYNVHVSSEGYFWKEKTVSISGGGVLYCNFKLKKRPKTLIEPEE
jgi:hypothetical protein